ncbi:hypothetical protein Tco_1179341 [Tanacetum coccineum]
MAEQDIPPPTITAMKILIIRKGEYDIWSMRMRQYICHTDHNLWDVIVNEDLEEEPAPTTGETSAPPAPKTAKQLAARRNQERVKSILLLAIPDEYLLKFHNVADAKSLWEAIKSRFLIPPPRPPLHLPEHKGKEIAKPYNPQSESVSEEDGDPKQAQRDKDMQKNLALLAKYFKKLYKPTNNNLRTSSNSRNKTEDTTQV